MAVSQLVDIITPDDHFTWSIHQLAQEIEGFQLKGPGWYSKKGTWMLVINTDIVDVYTLLVFYDRDPREAFKAIYKAPVRLLAKD